LIPGHQFDTETATHYNYFRDYDPSIGRYAQSDPIGLRAGLNTYAYVEANPLSGVDLQGLLTCHYSLTAGTMDCEPNKPGNVGFHGSGWHSGQGACKDNPGCSQVKDEGPTPHMTCYSIGKEQAPKKSSSNRYRRNLRPFDPGFVYPRDALQIHSCGSTARDGCSKGCIVHNDANVRALSAILAQEDGDNMICVSH
jgi:RHS repeat-associated protein